jgi:hypothetical protein
MAVVKKKQGLNSDDKRSKDGSFAFKVLIRRMQINITASTVYSVYF